jgi:multicomponent Na+:H+ antiporter subunit D
MVVGAFLAVVQSDIKRMFAYSSISQIGYIIFAFGIGTPLAIAGGLFHLFNHACFKSLLFLDAGAIEYSTGTRDLDKMGSLSAKLPVTGATSLLASMSISGVPPLGGFWSKLLIIIAAVVSGHFVLALVAVLISIVTLVYYLKFQTAAFFAKPGVDLATVREVPFTMKTAMVILALLCVLSGFLLLPALKPLLDGATEAMVFCSTYKEAVFNAVMR